MNLSKQKEEELRKDWVREYHQKHNDLGIPIQVGSGFVSDWWLSKLSSALEEERSRLVKGVEELEKAAQEDVYGKMYSLNSMDGHGGYEVALSDVEELIKSGIIKP